MSHPQSIADIQKRLNDLSAEMITLIQKYGLDAAHPLDVIDTARRKISDQADYIRFLELSLEGRILGEVADQMGQTSGSA
ncbi:hypothetical protein [Kiloniella sp. b19]|uniref:hypothetical protein n=1 Tax=Kiloniella sp. GXU_MW_B19 TaxID=3141326 RepID=UPI0031DB6CE8